MLVIMKKKATEENLEQVKQFLVEHDCDFHQSTGAARTIIGIVGDTSTLNSQQLTGIPGVLDLYKIPAED